MLTAHTSAGGEESLAQASICQCTLSRRLRKVDFASFTLDQAAAWWGSSLGTLHRYKFRIE